MDPIIGGLITGGASLLGNIFNSQTSAQNTQAQLAAQQSFLNQSEQYNTQMSSTAYQRASADMTKAGLNPMMMFGSGGPASSPSLPVPQAPMPSKGSAFGNLGDAASKAVSTAVDVKTFDKLTQEIANLKAQQAQTEATTITEGKRPAAVEASTGLTKAQTVTEGQKPAQVVAETDRTRAGTALMDAQTTTERARGRLVELGLDPARVDAATARSILAIPQYVFDAATQSAWGGGKLSSTVKPLFDTWSALDRTRGLDLLKQRMNQGHTSTEKYTVRPGGWTKDVESWPFNP
jgi:hypothetical protein